MASSTQIEWTDSTWNPVTGCTKITRGCDFCYAERFSERFRGVAGHPFANGFDLTLRPERLEQPLHWRAPRRVFVNSMSDLFHKAVPFGFIDSVFDTMEAADWHVFQVLTKRSSLMVRYLRRRYGKGLAPRHIWLGVSIEDSRNTLRLNHLRSAQAMTKFVSFEPLLGPVGEIDLSGIAWAIVGGESGPRARPMSEEWAIEIRDQCRASKAAFFSSNGAASDQSPVDVSCKAENGINIRTRRNGQPWQRLPQNSEWNSDRPVLRTRADASEALYSRAVPSGTGVQGSHVQRHHLRRWLLGAMEDGNRGL